MTDVRKIPVFVFVSKLLAMNDPESQETLSRIISRASPVTLAGRNGIKYLIACTIEKEELNKSSCLKACFRALPSGVGVVLTEIAWLIVTP
jgi:hypothetical protein